MDSIERAEKRKYIMRIAPFHSGFLGGMEDIIYKLEKDSIVDKEVLDELHSYVSTLTKNFYEATVAFNTYTEEESDN